MREGCLIHKGRSLVAVRTTARACVGTYNVDDSYIIYSTLGDREASATSDGAPCLLAVCCVAV